jgi:hypothetical protein
MKTLRLIFLLGVTPPIVAMGCNDGVEAPGPYVSLQELDHTQQPTTQPLGVLVDVVASGGNVVRLEALGGVFANGNISTLCVNFPNPGINTTVVSVVPTQTEALVNAYLGNRAAADAGEPASAGSVLAEANDAGPMDAEIADAGGPHAWALAGTTPLPPLDPGCVETSFVAEDVSTSAVVSIGRAPVTSALDSEVVIESGAEVDASGADDGSETGDDEFSNDGTIDDGADGGTDAATSDVANGGTEDGDDGGNAS